MARTPLGAVTYANTLKPASTPGTGEDIQVERPPQQFRHLAQNIAPTRSRARLILVKGPDHKVRRVRLRKL
jgi:hypothetical protein